MLCLCSLEEQKCDHLFLILTTLKDSAETIVKKIDIHYMKVQFVLNITDSAYKNAYSLFVTSFNIKFSIKKIIEFAHIVDLYVLHGSKNKQQLFPYTALTNYFYN
jgi:hypothetical protein